MIDSQLMERYVTGHDSLAFRDLVARHGPAVLRVCRRFVHDPHDAEDAMQATFLILVQRAPSIRDPEQLDRWLAGVARRVAARARKRTLLRTEREQRWAETRAEVSTDAEKPMQAELRRAVREELGRLSDADRQPLTLCYLDGLTHEEAARRLGCPVGTVKARLVRARRRLRDHLDRRGVALSLGLLLFLLRRPADAVADDARLRSTVEVMSWSAVGDTEAVQACYPVAFRLARICRVEGWLPARRSALALLLGLALITLGGAVAAAHVAAGQAERVQAKQRLARLLDVNCQVTP